MRNEKFKLNKIDLDKAKSDFLWKALVEYTRADYKLIYETIFEKCQSLFIDEDVDHRCYTYGRQTGEWKEIAYDLFEHYWKKGDIKEMLIKMIT